MKSPLLASLLALAGSTLENDLNRVSGRFPVAVTRRSAIAARQPLPQSRDHGKYTRRQEEQHRQADKERVAHGIFSLSSASYFRGIGD